MDLPEYSSRMRDEPTVVCLCGPSGAGKSTLADRLAEHDELREVDRGT